MVIDANVSKTESEKRETENIFFGVQAPRRGQEEKPNPYSCWQTEYYRPYFDLSTKVAMRRILKVLWPFFKLSFVESEEKADLYVPMWAYFTLVITMSSFGSLVHSLQEAKESGGTVMEFQLDVNKINSCASIFGFFFFINPAVFCVFFKFTGSPIGLAQILCMAGYSFVPFVPVSFLFVLPYAVLRAALLIGAACLGMHFLYRNMGGLCEKYLKGYTYFVRSYMILIQVLLIFVIYFVFFD